MAYQLSTGMLTGTIASSHSESKENSTQGLSQPTASSGDREGIMATQVPNEFGERFLGVIPNAGFKSRLGFKLARYDLFLTDRRMIVAKAGTIIPWLPGIGALAAAIPPASFQSRADRYEGRTFDQILSMKEGNVSIPYETVERAVLKEGSPGLLEVPRLTLWTGKGRQVFQFDRVELERAIGLFSIVLSGRLQVRRSR